MKCAGEADRVEDGGGELRMVNRRIRVLVVDDSAFMRILISDMLNSEQGIEVAGVAKDGLECIEKMKELSPDVITMDVEMPRMNGLEALKRIMRESKESKSSHPHPHPHPQVVMLSGITAKNADVTVEALANGAFDFVLKPSGTLSLDIEKVREELIAKIKCAAESRYGSVGAPGGFRRSEREPGGGRDRGRGGGGVRSRRVIVIGASTGGPRSLVEIFSRLPVLPAGILVVQHMPPYFTSSLARRLDKHSEWEVREAAEGDEIKDGIALVAPGDLHMTVNGSGTIHLNRGPPVNAIRPSVDVTMESVARSYGSNSLGVLLTGMGKDGAEGMRAIKEHGGMTITSDEHTSIIFGMPREAIKRGCVDMVLPLHEIAGAITEAVIA